EKEATYKNVKLNGDWTEYDTQGRRKVYKKFENDMLKKVVLYSNMGSVPAWEYNIEYPEQQGDPLSLEVKHLRGDTTEYTNYRYGAEYPIDNNSFVADFDKAKNTGKAYRDGTYEKYANDVLLYSGNYTEGKKDGVWEYDLTEGVRWQKTFEAGRLVKEYFINIQGKTPFEGDYILKYRGGGMRCLFKIKEGYRNGKSRYYDRKGIEVRTEKYKEGQLQK
ncbi:MAG: hypothetical protein ACE5DN_03655, partial [Flavobacteriales bacterium]